MPAVKQFVAAGGSPEPDQVGTCHYHAKLDPKPARTPQP